MRANVFRAPGRFGIETKPVPSPAMGEAIVRVTRASVCATDLHIVNGEFPVRPGLTLGHEAVGVVHELGDDIFGYEPGQRVLFGSTTPCGQCENCLSGHAAHCQGHLGGWRLGNTIDGAQAEFVRIPFAQANLVAIPEALADEEVLLLGGVASGGFAAVENGRVRLGDEVVIFGQGPIGLCATVAARLRGAARIFAVDADPFRLAVARRMGADVTLPAGSDPVAAILLATDGRGVAVAIEAYGGQSTFSNALACLAPGGVLSSVGVYSKSLTLDLSAIEAGLAGKTIVTTLNPGGKGRLSRLLRLVVNGRVDLSSLLTHRFPLDRITDAYDLARRRGDNVLKVSIEVS
jgi:threonine dehydrogenase-like Zn-dependent dehydrogenase